MPIPSICWLAALIVLILVEAATVGLVSLWFALGALAALLTSFWVNSIWVQLGVFLAVSLVTLLVIRPLARRYITPRQVATNADRAVGAEGIVTQAIDNLKASGQVSVLGSVWTARAQGDVFIPAGTTVKVLRIEGVKLIVSPVREEVPQ
ncbi:NfeD family protein [Pseudoflavonifractor phocaeensis]|uniref:NfeD family protein n=1 Tax=Pseudoflavonifractor phocaeensis TaxID=1870988 RepID=UPI001956CE61|nr:NfeD family protein [Pseudoflavonifractor phocaeensis]MBM6925400.1 NfeD family protein [Pseudoflavonifractor phocaeensis]